MHIYAPERPEISPGIKALLTDGSAIPHMVCTVKPNGSVRLACLLRNYDSADAYNYSYHAKDFWPDALPEFWQGFMSDPERALYLHFKWVPRTPGRRTSNPHSRQIAPATDFDAAANLL